ncbi:MAG: hypothetical protein JWP76_1398 [Dactylosporangium sp.]|nr:hypothetical protein [Dactylosporangium sp.]
MIVGSLLLIVVAIALLATGLVNGSNAYLVGSTAASLLAAIALVVGSRQASAARAHGEDEPAPGHAGSDGEDGPTAVERHGDHNGEREPMTEVIPAHPRPGVGDGAAQDEIQERRPLVAARPLIPTQGGARDLGSAHPGQLVLDDDRDESDKADDFDDEPLSDEPVAQRVSAGDADRVARMSDDVLVIDGRPRYHLANCVHLLGQPGEALPVHEAVELGFTPCGLCEPDRALLAEARQV